MCVLINSENYADFRVTLRILYEELLYLKKPIKIIFLHFSSKACLFITTKQYGPLGLHIALYIYIIYALLSSTSVRFTSTKSVFRR